MTPVIDFIANGQASGDVGSRLMASNFDPRVLRPYVNNSNQAFIDSVVPGGEVVANALATNANATLRKDEWQQLDQAVLQAGRERLNLVADLRSSGLIYAMQNGMGTSSLLTQAASETIDAKISMSPVAKSDADQQEFSLENLPLPIIHVDFHMDLRQLQTGRNMGQPLDTSFAAQAGRRVAETAEKLAIGVLPSFQFGGGSVYGIFNHPSRVTVTVTAPGNNVTTLSEVLAMKTASQDVNKYGPWKLYVGPGWDAALDDDYSPTKGDITLRERILKIEGINAVKTLDFLGSTEMILVEQSTDTIREVIGMDLTTVQWSTHGGLMQHMKVMAILVPQIRADFNGQCGIVHASV